MNRIESSALGIAAGAAVGGYLGAGKLVIAGFAIAVVSFLWRRYVLPLIG